MNKYTIISLGCYVALAVIAIEETCRNYELKNRIRILENCNAMINQTAKYWMGRCEKLKRGEVD